MTIDLANPNESCNPLASREVEKANATSPKVAGMAGKTGRPTLPKDQRERVRAVLEELRHEKFDDNQAALARALDIKPPSLFTIMQGTGAPALPTLEKIAELRGVDLDTLLGKTPKPSPAAPTRFIEIDGRYPNLAKAVAMARIGEVREAAVERVASSLKDSEQDLPVFEWLDEIRSAERKVRREELQLAQDVEQARKVEEANAVHAAEAEKASKPNLKKRRT